MDWIWVKPASVITFLKDYQVTHLKLFIALLFLFRDFAWFFRYKIKSGLF